MNAEALRRANEIIDTGDDWTPEHVEMAGRALSKGYADQWQAYRLGVYHGVLAEMERAQDHAATEPVLVLVPLETLRVRQREVVVVDVPEGESPRSWVGRLARLGSRLVRITAVGTFALPDGATFRRCDLMVEDAPDDLREQVSVRQFSCIHGVEPDGWCAQCDPEESARYLDSLGGGR